MWAKFQERNFSENGIFLECQIMQYVCRSKVAGVISSIGTLSLLLKKNSYGQGNRVGNVYLKSLEANVLKFVFVLHYFINIVYTVLNQR